MQTNQTPEALAEEALALVNKFGRATVHATARVTDENLETLMAAETDLKAAITRLRDMAASRAKDAERYQMVRRGQRWSVINGIGDELKGEALDAAADAAIAATKTTTALSHCPICGELPAITLRRGSTYETHKWLTFVACGCGANPHKLVGADTEGEVWALAIATWNTHAIAATKRGGA